MPDKSLQIDHGNPEGPRIAGKRSRARGCATTPAYGPSRWCKTWSAGVPPARPGARASRPQKNKCGQDARAPQSNRPQHRHSEKPRERGLTFALGSTPRPGVKRRASRPPTAAKARQRAFLLQQRLISTRAEYKPIGGRFASPIINFDVFTGLDCKFGPACWPFAVSRLLEKSENLTQTAISSQDTGPRNPIQKWLRSGFSASGAIGEPKDMRAEHFRMWIVLWAVSSTAPVLAQSAVQWQPNLENAKQIAAQTNRLVLIHFWTEACPPCMRMEREVFSRPEVAAAIHANYVPVRINVQKLPNVAREYGVSAWPTDIILSPSGQIVERKTGAANAFQYIAALNQIATRHRGSLPGQSVAQPSPNQIYQTNPAIAAQRNDLPNHSYPTVGQQSPVAQPAAPSGFDSGKTANHGDTDPPGMMQPGQVKSQAWQPEITQWNRGAMPAPAANYNPGHVPGGHEPPAGPAAGSQNAFLPEGRNSPHFSSANQNPPSWPTPPELPRQPDLANPAAPPALGLDGYCPVTLLEQERWVRGDPRYGVIHRGRTYLFVGPEEAKRFFADPDRFAPVLSGIDVVLAVEENRQIPGKREHGAWYEGRMYLFSSEASLRKFDQDPSRYAAVVNQVARANPHSQPSHADTPFSRGRLP